MSTKNMPDATVVTAEKATEEQLGHILDQQKRRIRARGLTKDEANVIIRNGNRYLPVMDKAADVLIDQVRSRIPNIIIRSFECDRALTPQQALDATGCKQYVNSDIVATMPRLGPLRGQIEYFKPRPQAYVNGRISGTALAKEYKFVGLKPDPKAQAADNAAHPEFAERHPNGTHWPLEGGGYGFLAFKVLLEERCVNCYRVGDGWIDDWIFGGVRLPKADKEV